MKPKLSLIVPVCNVEKYLEQCLTSIQNQTLKNIEVICVDDGSTDNCPAIIEKFVLQDKRFSVITKPNSGYGNSVNIGISKATGEYIGIVESDDFVESDMFESLYNLARDDNADVIKSNFFNFFEMNDGTFNEYVDTDRKNIPEIKSSVTLRDCYSLLWGHPSIWSGIYRRDFLIENNIVFMEEPGGGWVDNPFFFETLFKAKSIKWTGKAFYHYRKTNVNSSSNSIGDLTLPIRRMIDNLGVARNNDFIDETTQKFLYARALMYLHGVIIEKYYDVQKEKIVLYARKLMESLNENTIVSDFNILDKSKYFKFLSPLKRDLLETKREKILIYNWCPFDNFNRAGGGVTIYSRNLVETICRERPDVDLYFFSSGWAYDASTTDVFYRKIPNEFGDLCQSFEIVNSPVPAAQKMLLKNFEVAFKNEALCSVFDDFLNKFGKFKAVHFQNIEGISLDILELKKKHPETQFVFSIHNYVPMCPTGFYFKRNKECNCTPNHLLQDCKNCLEKEQRREIAHEVFERGVFGARGRAIIQEQEWLSALGLNRLDDNEKGELLYLKFSELAISNLNENMDTILAVSDRVRKIAVENGFDKSKTKTSYIGTKIAEYQLNKSCASVKKYFTIGYLGSDYKVVEKGYKFFVESLQSLDDETAKKVDVVLTVNSNDDKVIAGKLTKFHSVKIKHGYNHSELGEILNGVNLGVIPVLWEDNLPQIAIEMVALGIPILTSDFGGASELCKNDLFVFEGGNQKDFLNHVKKFVENPDLVGEFWKYNKHLTTMNEHLNEIFSVYGIPEPVKNNVTFSYDEYKTLLKENAFLYGAIEKLSDENYYLRNYRNSERRRCKLYTTWNYLKANGIKSTIKKIVSKIKYK